MLLKEIFLHFFSKRKNFLETYSSLNYQEYLKPLSYISFIPKKKYIFFLNNTRISFNFHQKPLRTCIFN